MSARQIRRARERRLVKAARVAARASGCTCGRNLDVFVTNATGPVYGTRSEHDADCPLVNAGTQVLLMPGFEDAVRREVA
jgi:hypothetical protein